jgi:hypothetical protein
MPNAGRRAVVVGGRRTSGHARESLARLLVRSAPTGRWTSPVRALTSMAANIAVAAPIHPDEQRLSRSRSTARASRRARLQFGAVDVGPHHHLPSPADWARHVHRRRLASNAIAFDAASARSTSDRGGAWHPESQGLDRTARSESTRGCAGWSGASLDSRYVGNGFRARSADSE